MEKGITIICFSPKRSTSIPDGMDITPYAIKKAKGRNPAMVLVRLKLIFTSGSKGFSMLVKKEITAKIIKIKNTIK